MNRDSTASSSPHFFLAAFTLWQREITRFYRQPSRVVGALGSPLLFWLLIGSGLGRSFRADAGQNTNYLEFFFPGTLVLILLFTAIFSTISIIEDRREGFLQAVLAAPISRGSLVLGKILGGTSLAALQGIVFLLLAPLAHVPITLASGLESAAVLFLVGFGLTGLGFLIAWPMESTQGFHAIMNLFLIPMWLLSGALFPPSGASGWIQWIMRLNPLTYGLDLLRHTLYGGLLPGHESATVPLLVTIAFCAGTYAVSWWMVCRRKKPVT